MNQFPLGLGRKKWPLIILLLSLYNHLQAAEFKFNIEGKLVVKSRQSVEGSPLNINALYSDWKKIEKNGLKTQDDLRTIYFLDELKKFLSSENGYKVFPQMAQLPRKAHQSKKELVSLLRPFTFFLHQFADKKEITISELMNGKMINIDETENIEHIAHNKKESYYYENKINIKNSEDLQNRLRNIRNSFYPIGQKGDRAIEHMVINGGGPVGLMSFIKSYLSGVPSVTLFNNRKSYEREYILRLDTKHIQGLSTILGMEILCQLINTNALQIFYKSKNQNILGPSGVTRCLYNKKGDIQEYLEGHLTVKIKTLEKILAYVAYNIAMIEPKFKVLQGHEISSNSFFSDNKAIIALPSSKFAANLNYASIYVPNAELIVLADGGRSDIKQSFLNIDVREASSKAYAIIGTFQNRIGQTTKFRIEDDHYGRFIPRLSPDKIAPNLNDVQRTRLFLNRESLYLTQEIDEDLFYELQMLKASGFKYYKEKMLGFLKKALLVHDLPSSYIDDLDKNVVLQREDQLGFTHLEFALTKSTSFYSFDNELNRGFLVMGDSAATTHFFTGTGVNRGLDDTDLLKEFLEQHSEESRLNERLFQEYDEKVNESVKKMHDKSFGIHSGFPDITPERPLFQHRK